MTKSRIGLVAQLDDGRWEAVAPTGAGGFTRTRWNTQWAAETVVRAYNGNRAPQVRPHPEARSNAFALAMLEERRRAEAASGTWAIEGVLRDRTNSTP